MTRSSWIGLSAVLVVAAMLWVGGVRSSALLGLVLAAAVLVAVACWSFWPCRARR